MFILAASTQVNENKFRAKEILGQNCDQTKLAEIVYGKWPNAVTGPYTTNVSKSKYFGKKEKLVVLLVWESEKAMLAGIAPVAFVQETQEGFNPEIWMKNLRRQSELRQA